MRTLLLFLLAVVPGIVLTIFFRQRDRFQLEPWPVVRNSFLLGMLSVVPAAILEIMLLPNQPRDLIGVAIYMTAGVGLIEELTKWATIRVYAFQHKAFDELMDGIVYGAAAAAGFATLENVGYVFQYGFATGIIRAVYSVPMHVMTGAVIGYWIAKRRFDNGSLWLAVPAGLLFPIAMHGIFNLGATMGSGLGLTIMSFVMAALLSAVIIQVRHALAISRMQTSGEAIPTDMPEAASASLTAIEKPSGSGWRALAITMLVLAAAVSAVFSAFLWLGLWLMIQDGETVTPVTYIVAMVPPLGTVLFCSLIYKIKKSAPKS